MRDKRTTENVIVHKRDKTSESNNMTDDDLDLLMIWEMIWGMRRVNNRKCDHRLTKQSIFVVPRILWFSSLYSLVMRFRSSLKFTISLRETDIYTERDLSGQWEYVLCGWQLPLQSPFTDNLCKCDFQREESSTVRHLLLLVMNLLQIQREDN